MALLTFLIHVSGARVPPARRLLGNLAGKFTRPFLYVVFFSVPRICLLLFVLYYIFFFW